MLQQRTWASWERARRRWRRRFRDMSCRFSWLSSHLMTPPPSSSSSSSLLTPLEHHASPLHPPPPYIHPFLQPESNETITSWEFIYFPLFLLYTPTWASAFPPPFLFFFLYIMGLMLFLDGKGRRNTGGGGGGLYIYIIIYTSL